MIHQTRPSVSPEDALTISAVDATERSRIIPFVAHGGTSGCLCFDQETDRLLLVRQYRPVVDAELLEIPSGRIVDGESARNAAIRETAEETGRTPNDLIDLGFHYSSVGLTNERIHLFAAYSWSDSTVQFAELTTEWIGFDRALYEIGTGQFVDGKTVVAVLRLAQVMRRGDRQES